MVPALACIIGHFVKPRNLSVFLGHCCLFFARGVRSSPHPSQVDSSLSPVACVWPDLRSQVRVLVIGTNAVLLVFIQSLHNSPIVGGKLMWSVALAQGHVQGTNVSSSIVLCTSTTRATWSLQHHTTGSLHHLGPFGPPPIHRQQTHRLSLWRVHQQQVGLCSFQGLYLKLFESFNRQHNWL